MDGTNFIHTVSEWSPHIQAKSSFLECICMQSVCAGSLSHSLSQRLWSHIFDISEWVCNVLFLHCAQLPTKGTFSRMTVKLYCNQNVQLLVIIPDVLQDISQLNKPTITVFLYFTKTREILIHSVGTVSIFIFSFDRISKYFVQLHYLSE